MTHGFDVPYIGDVNGTCVPLDKAPRAWDALTQQFNAVRHTNLSAKEVYDFCRALCCKFSKIANGGYGQCDIRKQSWFIVHVPCNPEPFCSVWFMNINITEADAGLFERYLEHYSPVPFTKGSGSPSGVPESCPGGFCDA